MLRLVQTENGMLRGLPGNNARISVFKGVPFASAPVGKNRWRAPQPCENWEGIRDAFKFAPISMQDVPGLGTDIYCKEWHVDPDIDMAEDCLYLNIWTNARTPDDKLPVLVWFFGGAFQWGYTPEMEFNGENIAKRGVIVVEVNYRLGAFGFLSHPDLLSNPNEANANFGLLDQQAGLKWVIRNIANFGGDPNNITIAGQSAGGGSVMSHLTSKRSEGLFQKAIILSGIINQPFMHDKVITPIPVEEVADYGQKLLERLGVKTIDEARTLDASFIRDVYGKFRAENNFFFTPAIDHQYLDDEPFKLFVQGKHANVPLISGNTFDEFHDFIYASSDEEFKTKANDIFGETASEFLKFDEAHKVSGNAYSETFSIESAVKACMMHNDSPSYYYCFEPDIPGEDNPGTFHSVDLWFFFDNLDYCWRPFVGRHYDLARKMCNYFTNFMKTGNPNGLDVDGTELPTWNPYSKDFKNEMHFTSQGPRTSLQTSEYKEFITSFLESYALGKRSDSLASSGDLLSLPRDKKQAVNPYLPSWEYIPDGEPYVFGNRVYVYGSHDYFNGHAFCLGDYVCWSAPVNDLGNWTYEGVTLRRVDDPANTKDNCCLYAPDVTIGPDGKYYLFYVLDRENFVSVAVCDTPAGKYEFLGYVHYENGELLGKREGDEPQFDPGVLTIGENTYLYTGFCGQGDTSRHGCMVTVLGPDMLTIRREPQFVLPNALNSAGTGFEKHAFFEAPSIRERNGIYYLIYSSEVMHELCYSMSDNPLGPFTYGGVIISNTDLGIDSYKPADVPAAYGANNHGSIVQIESDWYIFYHRHTLNTWYSRQGCAEKISFTEDGHIIQAHLTSCGLNGGPLKDTEEYPSYIVCNIFDNRNITYLGAHNLAYVTQEGRDGDENLGYVSNINNGTTLGYKYFDFKDVTGIVLTTRGYGNGVFEIRTSIGGEILAEVPTYFCTAWETHEVPCAIPDGVAPLYITYNGNGNPSIKSIAFVH